MARFVHGEPPPAPYRRLPIALSCLPRGLLSKPEGPKVHRRTMRARAGANAVVLLAMVMVLPFASAALHGGNRRGLRFAEYVFDLPDTIIEFAADKVLPAAVNEVATAMEDTYVMVNGIVMRWESDACEIKNLKVR